MNNNQQDGANFEHPGYKTDTAQTAPNINDGKDCNTTTHPGYRTGSVTAPNQDELLNELDIDNLSKQSGAESTPPIDVNNSDVALQASINKVKNKYAQFEADRNKKKPGFIDQLLNPTFGRGLANVRIRDLVHLQYCLDPSRP